MKILYTVLVWLIVAILFYLTISFVQWDWFWLSTASKEVREIVAVVYFLFLVIVTAGINT